MFRYLGGSLSPLLASGKFLLFDGALGSPQKLSLFSTFLLHLPVQTDTQSKGPSSSYYFAPVHFLDQLTE